MIWHSEKIVLRIKGRNTQIKKNYSTTKSRPPPLDLNGSYFCCQFYEKKSQITAALFSFSVQYNDYYICILFFKLYMGVIQHTDFLTLNQIFIKDNAAYTITYIHIYYSQTPRFQHYFYFAFFDFCTFVFFDFSISQFLHFTKTDFI